MSQISSNKIKIIANLIVLLFAINSCTSESSEIDNTVSENLDFQKNLDVETNQFEISQKSDTIIFGQSGTAIFIPSNSFENSQGNEVDKVEISLKEYYDLSDMLVQDLSTETETGFLETGGMINIQASAEGNEVYLKSNKNLIVHFPRNGNTNDMRLFSQSFTDSPNDIIKWKEEKSTGGYEIDTITPFIIKYEDLDSDIMQLTDGTNIWDWLEQEIVLTNQERDYVRLRDVNINFLVTKTGKVTQVELERDYDKGKCSRIFKIIKDMPDLVPFKRSGNVIDMESWVNFAVKFIPPSYLSDKEYLSAIENKYPEFEKKSINDIDQVELNYYIFTTAKLGWLNCDYFINDPSPKVDMRLTLTEPENLMVKFVYKDLKSIITPTFENGIYHFKGIPEGKNISLIVIRNDKKNVKMSVTEHVTANGELKGVALKEYTLGELKNELSKLN